MRTAISYRSPVRGRLAIIGMSLAVVVALLMWVVPTQVRADHAPADKVVAAGSTLEVTDAQTGPVELLSASLKTSSPTDLMLQVTAECALWTDVATSGNDSSSAVARVEIWVEVDGQVVPVDSTDTATGGIGGTEVGQAERGRVVFCNRAFGMTTTGFDDDMAISMFNRTRSANGFNWLTLNVGNGQHDIKVFGQLTTEVSPNAFAKAIVGKRTLIVEPAKLANDASI